MRETVSGLTIIVPVHNEAGTVQRTLPEMVAAAGHLGVPFEMLVCENGSSDTTEVIVDRLAAGDARIRVEKLPVGDYGRALQHSIAVARYEKVVIFNVDYWSADFMKTALAGLDAHDMVIGSKVLGRDTRPMLRRVITRGFNAFLRVAFGFRGTDTHGMKAFRRDIAGGLAAECVSRGWIFDTELVLRAERHGLRIVERPVDTMEIRAPSYAAILARMPVTVRNILRMSRALRAVPRRSTRSVPQEL
jgi:glycosyltransferase involved in cell wall biosynthesis